MKIAKTRRRRRVRTPNPEKVFRGFVRALGKLRERPAPQTQSADAGSNA